MLKGFKLAPHPDCDGEPSCLCPQCMAQLQKEVEEIEADWDETERKASSAPVYPVMLYSEAVAIQVRVERIGGVIGLPTVPHYLKDLSAYRRVVSAY